MRARAFASAGFKDNVAPAASKNVDGTVARALRDGPFRAVSRMTSPSPAAPAVVITSIAGAEHPILRAIAQGTAGAAWRLLIIGDTKSPAAFELPGAMAENLAAIAPAAAAAPAA